MACGVGLTAACCTTALNGLWAPGSSRSSRPTSASHVLYDRYANGG
jgi:hypothetical protein